MINVYKRCVRVCVKSACGKELVKTRPFGKVTPLVNQVTVRHPKWHLSICVSFHEKCRLGSVAL